MTGKERRPMPEVFWSLFAKERERLYRTIFSGNAYAAYERIGELLSRADYPHVYEVSSDEDHALLIFTPESDPEVASVIDTFVGAAPSIPGWRIFSRRQRRPVEDAFAMLERVYEVDASDAVFSIQEKSDGFDIQMHTKAAEILGEQEKEGFVSFFLEHALGEELAMSMIRSRAVVEPGMSKGCLAPKAFVERMVNRWDSSGK